MRTNKALHVALIFAALVGALWTLADIAGNAAWNGVNFAVGTYLFFGALSVLGLLVALFASWSDHLVFTWIGGLSAATVACLDTLFICGFLFRRDASVPLSDPEEFARIWAPYLLWAGCALVFSLAILPVSLGRIRSAQRKRSGASISTTP